MACTPDFVVVSKPAGVPAAPTVDNLLECAPTCTAQALGHSQALRITHRLDQCTEGLLVLGRSKAFVAAFNELVQRSSSNSNSSSGSGGAVAGGQSAGSSACAAPGSPTSSSSSNSSSSAPRPLRKFYRATTAAAPPPLGLLRHHLSIEQRQQGLPAFTIAHDRAVEGSLPAELRVLEVQPIRWVGGGALCCATEALPCNAARNPAGVSPVLLCLWHVFSHTSCSKDAQLLLCLPGCRLQLQADGGRRGAVGRQRQLSGLLPRVPHRAADGAHTPDPRPAVGGRLPPAGGQLVPAAGLPGAAPGEQPAPSHCPCQAVLLAALAALEATALH